VSIRLSGVEPRSMISFAFAMLAKVRLFLIFMIKWKQCYWHRIY